MRCINEALTKNRLDLINKNKIKQNKEIPLVLSSRYNPWISKLKQCIIKHWHTLNQDEVCKEIFTEKPIIAYKRHRNLADLLTSAKLKKWPIEDHSLKMAALYCLSIIKPIFNLNIQKLSKH
jgi:hypothetical protein